MAKENSTGKDWTEKQLKLYAVNFDEADKDQSGALRFREVCQALVMGGFRGSYKEAKKIFKELDKDSDKTISRVEFIGKLGDLPLNDQQMMAMRREFRTIDTNNSGNLNRKEVLDAIRNAELDPTTEAISGLLIALVKDKDGLLDYEEFLAAWNKKKVA